MTSTSRILNGVASGPVKILASLEKVDDFPLDAMRYHGTYLFDWQHRSSMLLYTQPPNGYASVSMVDLYYLGFEGTQDIPWSKRLLLLATPYATIDGMNECGVAISQNAVPDRKTPIDYNKVYSFKLKMKSRDP